MSELYQKNNERHEIRLTLLTGASAMALSVYVWSMALANAEVESRPTLWIELGGQLSQLSDNSEPFAPNFTSMRPATFSPSQDFEKSPRYSFDEYGKILLHPDGSNWQFSASIQYGRSNTNKHIRQQTHPAPMSYSVYPANPSFAHFTKYPRANRFADTVVRNSEQHIIADFQAGKDVGLGLFGNGANSVVSLGVRFAQFIDKSNISLKSDPDWHFKNKYYSYYGSRLHFLAQPYHSNAAQLLTDRSFRGIGPELSWAASVPVAGNIGGAELDFDWGVNAAVLFGRQKTRTEHHETERYNSGGYGAFFNDYGELATIAHTAPPPRTRSRDVIVPNVGGFAGISFKYDVAKVSFGYRADFFFGAMDGGIDTRKTYERDFYGPYATISIGLGG